jgi:pyrroline-5-carboxylate reductase
MTYGVLGVGALGAAVVTGLCAGVEDAPRVLLSPRNAQLAAGLAERFETVEVCTDNQAVLDGADVVLICLRAQVASDALCGLRFGRATLVRAMAGVSLERLRRLGAAETVRAIPLPSVARREGITPIHPPNREAKALFDRLGETVELEDAHAFEAFFASTATIASHFAYLHAIAGWLEAQGIPAPAARHYVASMFAGLAAATRSGEPFAALAADHATPGGLNEQLLSGLEAQGTFAAVERELQRVLERLTP